MHRAVEEGLAKNTDVADACKHGLSTDFYGEVDKLARKEAALPSGFAEIGTSHGLTAGAVHWE